jgi:hypothetical protein
LIADSTGADQELVDPRRRLGEIGFAGALHIVVDGVDRDSVSPDMGRFER